MSTSQPLLMDHFDAAFGHALRNDGGEEPMVFLTLHVRSAGTALPLPTVWIPPAQPQHLIDSLQATHDAAVGRTPDSSSGTPKH